MRDDLIDQFIDQMSRVPGLGPRSARRVAIYLLQKRPETLAPLAKTMTALVDQVRTCVTCGNISTEENCHICRDEKRERSMICVLENVADLWAFERANFFRGQYHVLGGVLSAFDGVGPDQLRIPYLVRRVAEENIEEVVLALGATIDGQTTAHYITDALSGTSVKVSMLAKGVPLGSELDYLDEGTIETAFRSRA